MKVQINDETQSVFELEMEHFRSCKLITTMLEVNESVDPEIKLENIKNRKLMEFAVSCLSRPSNSQNVEFIRIMAQDVAIWDMFSIFQELQCNEWLEYVSMYLAEIIKEKDITQLKEMFQIGPFITQAQILCD